MLVDAEKAKEKLAKLAESDDWENPLQLAHLIRAADLSDCSVDADFLEAAHAWQLKAERFERLYVTAEKLRESPSAQVAELTKQAVSLANQTGRALSRAEAAEAQVAELKGAVRDFITDYETDFMWKGELVDDPHRRWTPLKTHYLAMKALDAAKEGKC